MKTTIKLLSLLMVMAGFVSCESIKSLADVEFETNVNTDLDIKVADQAKKSAQPPYDWDTSAVLNPTLDPEVKKYVDKIQRYEVNSITATVTWVSGPDIKLLADTWFMLSDDTDHVTWTLPENFNATVNNSYTLGNDNNEWTIVNRILGRNAEFTLSSAGESNQNNVTVVLKLSIGAIVTANPL